MEKKVIVDERAKRELGRFPRIVQLKFRALFHILKTTGKIEEPLGKKLVGQVGIFELRIKFQRQWRALYAYIDKEYVVVLSAFKKKTQKTPQKELIKANKRLNEYKEAL